MGASKEKWVEALLSLHASGWDPYDIEAACETLTEACEDGDYRGADMPDLSCEEVGEILESEIDEDDASALLTLAEVRSLADDDSDALRDALFDLDAFADGYADEEDRADEEDD